MSPGLDGLVAVSFDGPTAILTLTRAEVRNALSVEMCNAIVDALAEFGVRHIEMPATPERVWRAIREAQAQPAGGA